MNILDNIEAGFSSAVERLRTAATQFSGAYSQFVNIPVEYRSPTWADTKQRADTVKGIISTFTGAIDSAYKWLSSAFGLSGLGQLGLLVPAVPWLTVAAVGGAISAIMVSYSYMIEELNKSAYKKQLMTVNAQRIEQGLEPLDLTQLTQTGPTIFGEAGSLVKWVVIGGAALFIVPKLIEKYKGR
jgi:hypothetical protein